MAARRVERFVCRAVRRTVDLAAWSLTVALTVPVTLKSTSLIDANQPTLLGLAGTTGTAVTTGAAITTAGVASATITEG